MINFLINGSEFPFPTKFNIQKETVEQVNQTEAGTDQVIVARSGKLTASVEFQLSSRKYRALKSYSDEPSISVVLPEAGIQTVRTMRIRNFNAELVEDSRKTLNTEGLWRVSCEFIEF